MQSFQDIHHYFRFEALDNNQIFIPCASRPLLFDDSSCSSSCSSVILSPIDRNIIPPPRDSNPILNDPRFNQLYCSNISPTNMVCYTSSPSSSFSMDSSLDDCFVFD